MAEKVSDEGIIGGPINSMPGGTARGGHPEMSAVPRDVLQPTDAVADRTESMSGRSEIDQEVDQMDEMDLGVSEGVKTASIVIGVLSAAVMLLLIPSVRTLLNRNRLLARYQGNIELKGQGRPWNSSLDARESGMAV